jgi:hypothetical protein
MVDEEIASAAWDYVVFCFFFVCFLCFLFCVFWVL